MSHSIAVTLLFSYLVNITGVLDKHDPYIAQMLMFLLVFLPPTVFYFVAGGKGIKDGFYTMPLGVINLILVVIIVFLALPLLILIADISALIMPERLSDTAEASYISLPFWLMLLTSAALPAFFEETIFRGVVFNKKYDLPLGKRVLLSGLFFAIAHLNPVMFLYAFAGGALFSCLMLITRSITAPIVAHFTLNAFVLWVNNANEEYIQSGQAAAAETSAVSTVLYMIFLVALTLPVLMFAIYLLVLNNREKIALEAVLTKLKHIIDTQRERLSAAAEDGGLDLSAMELGGLELGPAEPAPAPVKKQIFTWEFWGVAVIYVAYVAIYYFL